MNRIIIVAIAGFLSIALVSCGKNKRFDVNTDSEKIEVKIQRFDRDLVKLDTSALDVEIQKLYEQYPEFMPVYVSDILGVNPNDTVEVRKLIYEFLSDTAFQSVNRKRWKHLTMFRQWSKAFQHRIRISGITFPK